MAKSIVPTTKPNVPTPPTPVSDATALDAVWVELNRLKNQIGPSPKGYAAIIMDLDSRIFPVRTKDTDGNGFTSKQEAVNAAKKWITDHNLNPGTYRAGVVEIF